MNKTEFFLTNKARAKSSLTIAGIYLIFMFVTLLTGTLPFENYSYIEFIFLPIAFIVIVLDMIDYWKVKNNKLKISFDQNEIVVYSFWFNTSTYLYDDIKDVSLNEKDIQFTYNGKKRLLSGVTQSDLIRLMKVLRDNCEE